MEQQKAGIKTSEFWLSLISTIAGIGLIIYGVVVDKDNAVMIGGVLAGLPTSAYTVGRSVIKRG